MVLLFVSVFVCLHTACAIIVPYCILVLASCSFLLYTRQFTSLVLCLLSFSSRRDPHVVLVGQLGSAIFPRVSISLAVKTELYPSCLNIQHVYVHIQYLLLHYKPKDIASSLKTQVFLLWIPACPSVYQLYLCHNPGSKFLSYILSICQ